MRLWYLLVAVGLGVAVADVDHHLINLAVLLPIADDRRPFSAVRLRPAVDLAVDHVSNLLLRRLRVSYSDSNCSAVYGIKEAISYYVLGPPNVYFGPICDFAVAPVARQSYFWGIPVVSVGAIDIDFLMNRRANYPLLTRAGPVNLVGMANAILEAMHVYGWRRVKLLYERDAGSDVIPPFCHLAAGAVVYHLESASTQRVARQGHYKFERNLTKMKFDQVLVNEVGHEFAGT